MHAHWPTAVLRSVPSVAEARTLALDLRTGVLGYSTGWCDLTKLCLEGAFRTKWADFTADRTSTHSALLVPRADGSFDIIVDPEPRRQGTEAALTTGMASVTRNHRFRFRVAHEIGHSFFYNRRLRPPRRRLPFSEAEEVFCDAFANALLVPPKDADEYVADTASVFDIHRKYEVSVEVAARALAHAHPDLSIFGLLRYRHARTKREGDRVVWSHGPVYIPREARLRSRAVDEARVGARAEAVEFLRLGALRGTYRVVAHRLPGRKLTVVVAARANSHERPTAPNLDGATDLYHGVSHRSVTDSLF